MAMSNLTVTERSGVLVVDSRLIAPGLGIQHKNFLATVEKYNSKMASHPELGAVAFETERKQTSQGNWYNLRWAWLTEQQLKSVLTYSRRRLTSAAIVQLAESGWDLSMFSGHQAIHQMVTESDYSDALSRKLDGKREVTTLAGRIDVLTQTEVIEVKPVVAWKCALGQVLVYGDYYPSHQKRIHLFGETQESFLNMIRKHCGKRNVIVTWEP